MALHPPAQGDKLIFAPAGASTNTRAAQFLRNPPLTHTHLHPDPITLFTTWFTSAQTSPPPHSVPNPETCCLSTASLPSGRVSSRFVYLKEVVAPSAQHPAGGFVIYTNLGTSRKSRDLATNSFASLAFWWAGVERQVRVEGRVEKLTEEETEVYWRLRERGSKVGAWASRQSGVLSSARAAALLPSTPSAAAAGDGGEEKDVKDGREVLESWVAETSERFQNLKDEEIPVPSKEWWGGIRIVPERIEFWQGRESRLHDRFVYVRQDVREKEEMENGEGDAGGVLEMPKLKEGETVTWVVERLSP